MTAEKLLNLLLSLSISGSVLFGIWMITRLLLKKKFSRRFHYYLLLIVLLRFVVPISPNQSLVGILFSSIESSSIYEMIHGSKATRNPSVIIGDNVVFTDNVIIGRKQQPVASYILYIWLAVSCSLMVQKITKYQSFTKYIKSDWQPVDDPEIIDILSEICEKKEITAPIDIYTTSLISSPLLLGITKNYIILPHEYLTKKQLHGIFSHEVTHYQNKDIFYKWLMQIIVCLHWFNPLIYFIEKVMNQECEYACDEATTRYFTKEERYDYGQTLIEMASSPSQYSEKVASVTLYENNKEIKKRLEAILLYQKIKKPKRFTTLLSVTGMIVTAFILGTATTASDVAPTDNSPVTDSETKDSSDTKPLGRPIS
ncbi:M56 family metallopeptidase [Enterococcus rotai]|uniref:M56 family metallopeptidase n=1 Tax=Enterococcus rotai TaxID=118060 RepID=UPI0035C70B7B